MKGSEIKSAAEQAEMKRALLEFTQKIEQDPYQPGIPHVDLYPDDIAEIIEDLIWIRGFDNITVKINKTGESIKIEVLERNK